ncbi:MAG: 4Fe-4S binding protein [Candidatus Eisenbacteria bacterium]|uniref:4Fe-4S binding protein n=1 Tax=Eiseniibacteriota bacterium TaxID=2212470 RepID=A0A948RUC0_UNCEI|nr:4Fe-4S binding protein [Candidatus Eisenbacteria bacterium]MBU1947745.1 4Fe-4S binding protein [Candidatus Eisenbacteria bacterium]MBU2690136.1 4Fe-4S binding protein [Candidatus Eisenbacteria bacterium]
MRKLRTTLQLSFLALTLAAVFIVKGNAERWCPFGGIEAIYAYFTDGNMPCSLGVSNFYILGAVLLMTLLLRRVFCGYVCPIGAISEWIHRWAVRIGINPFRISHRLDRVLSLLKYGVLALILYFTYRTGELIFRGYDPCYALLSRHGDDITLWAYVVSGFIIAGSILVTIPFCRWLCPLAAVLQPFSKMGLTRVRRDPEACTDCGLCAKSCLMAIPIDKDEEITAARCTTCLECVTVCPSAKRGALTWGPFWAPKRNLPYPVPVIILLLCIMGAVAASVFNPMPSFTYKRGAAIGKVASVELGIHDLTCRGRASLLVFFLDRDDEFEIPGYLKLEAWPGPGAAKAKIIYDPAKADAELVRQAVTEPYYNLGENLWRASPFTIEGYNPFGNH